MKLNLSIIGDCLPDSYQPKLLGIQGKSLSFGRPRLYEPGGTLLPGKLYLTYVQSLPRQLPVAGAAFICAGSTLPPELSSSGNQFLLLNHSPALSQLLNMVQDIYDRFEALDDEITAELSKGPARDLRQIVKYASELLENPLSVTDASLNMVLTAEASHTNGRLTFLPRDNVNPFSFESYCMIKDACLLERELRKPYVSSIASQHGRAYCYNLYYRDIFLGCAWFSESNRKFRNSDFLLADHVFQQLQQAVVLQLPHVNSPNNALHKLLSHDILSADEYDQFRLPPEEAWALLRLKESPAGNSIPFDYMLAVLDTLTEIKVYPAMFNGELTGLMRIPSGDEPAKRKAVLHYLRSVLERLDYICGVSNSFTDLDQVDTAYLEAGFALFHLQQQNLPTPVYLFRDCQLEYILSRICSELPLAELYSEKLLRLAAYDRTHSASCLKTLNLYLKTEMNATQTARLLFLHRSSLLKRLDKISQILGDDLSDPRSRLYYRLIFHAWETGYGADDGISALL